jgi:branched-subunit amino acid ABC-type transport system permease component
LVGPASGGDHNILVLSLVIVIAGGAGSVPGALAAALIVGQAQTTVLAHFPAVAAYAPYVMLIAVLTMRSVVERRAVLS